MDNLQFCIYLGIVLSSIALSTYADDSDYRLSTDVIPNAYDITIKPYLLPEDGDKQFTFEGNVSITLHALIENIREITIHKTYIDIIGVSLHNEDGSLAQNVEVTDLRYNATTAKLTVPLDTALVVHANYTLNVQYNGQMRNEMAGFYRVNYTDMNGNETWMGITQLQRIEARSVFPCFDEPAFKATFRMHINYPRNYGCYFNTRLLNNTHSGSDNRDVDHFEETPPMSTYLVAFIVSGYIARSDGEFAYIVRPEIYGKTDFSVEVAQRLLRAYGDYTQQPYNQLGNDYMQMSSSPKFPHNGMENWGLVLYKDAVLVQDPGYTDGWTNKQYTITIIAHETAHMWFGNSVTFAWWSYFWLNEGFARYYQYFFAHELFPEYQLNQQFVVNQVHTIFKIDAVNTTQPLTSQYSSINTPAEIASKFSSITYAKGAAIVRMIRNLMGENNFDGAIRDYLAQNHLKNTVPDDLFLHLIKHWPTTQYVYLEQFFYDWTEQIGYPVLNVSLSNNGRTVTLSQKRFLSNPTDDSDANLRYTIPISYTTDLEKDFNSLAPKFYFNKTEKSEVMELEKSIKWIIFNVQQSNYYRVFYDLSTLGKIREALMQTGHSGIHVINRAQLLDDLFSYGRAGLLEYDIIFEFLEYMSYETDYLPWYATFAGLEDLTKHFNQTQRQDFGKFLQEITKKVYAKLQFHNDADTVLDVYNRNKIIAWLCRYKNDECRNDAQNAYVKALTTGVKPSPDFRETLYCASNRFNLTNYQDFERWYGEESLPSEKELLLRAMGCTYYASMLEYHYARILSNQIPREYKLVALKPTYKENPDNITPLFEMIVLTVERLADALGSVQDTADVISDIANYFTTDEQLKTLENLIEQKREFFGDSISTLQKAVQTVEYNLQWADKHLATLSTYLARRNAANNIRISLLCILIIGINELLS